MCRKIFTAIFLVLIILGGCSKSSDPEETVTYADEAALLGLNHDHILHYMIYDSIFSYNPFSVELVTTPMTVEFNSLGSNQVVMKIDGEKHDLFTLDESGILHTGHFISGAIAPDTFNLFWPTPPIIIPGSYTLGSSWSVTTPPLSLADSTEQLMFMLFINYGFVNQRTFTETLEVILPRGSYDTYHFEATLLLDENATDTVMTIDEYFSEGVGLVKMQARAGNSFRRLIILLEDSPLILNKKATVPDRQ